MSDRARSSVRTETRDGSGTADGVPEAAPVDGGRDRPDAGTGSSVRAAPSGPHGSSAAPQTASQPTPVEAVAQRADQQSVRTPEPKAAPDPTPGKAPKAEATAPAPPAAHPVTPLAPAKATTPGGRPAEDAARPAAPARPVPPATGLGRSGGPRSGVPAGGQVPVDATQAVTLPPTAARPADQPARPSAARAAESGSRGATEAPAHRGRGRVAGKGPRRARLQLRHIDTWSALKISLVLSIALFCVWMVAVGILYGVLSQLGVFDTVNDLIGQLGSASGDEAGASDVINGKVVLGGAAVIGAVNIVLLTALCTVSAFVYNLCSDLVGGLEVTLAERE